MSEAHTANQDFIGKAVIVTGGGSGIGRATALRFAAAGASVAIADLNLISAEETLELIAVASPKAQSIAVETDVTKADALIKLVARTEKAFGHLDAVSSNAGFAAYPALIDAASESDFDKIFAVNVKSVWLTTRAVIPALRRNGGGSIVVTGSIMGERTRPGQSSYAASKAAANHLARSFALDLAVDHIRVNAVAPVATDTAMLPAFLGPDDPEAARARFIDSIPLGRLAQPEDIAEAIVYLSSDSAAFITGVVLPVDGGRGI